MGEDGQSVERDLRQSENCKSMCPPHTTCAPETTVTKQHPPHGGTHPATTTTNHTQCATTQRVSTLAHPQTPNTRSTGTGPALNRHAPTIFSDVSQSHRIVQEEIFGPVLAIQTFRTVDEVITKANNTPYGLSGGVWTDKGAKIFQVSKAIRSGVLWANTFNKFDPTSPFGGYKESGIGREGGLEGLMPYVSLV